MSKFQKQNKKCYLWATSVSLSEGTLHFVGQQKTSSYAVVLNVALAVRPIRSNTFGIN